MAHYLIEASYTTQSWSTQVDKPASPIDRITPAMEACGGKLQCLYYAFGDRDVVGIGDFPTPEAAAAFSLVISSSGATEMFRTTPLLTVDQGMESLRMAGEIRSRYAPPVTVSVVEQPVPAGT
jgi:uncharacterized protein with GYD domain